MKIVPEKGFTLIELIVVMAILTILAGQVIFSLTSSRARLKGEVFQLRGDMVLARSEAVNRNDDVLVDFVQDCEYKAVGGGSPAIDEDLCGSGTRDGYRICVDCTGTGCDDPDNRSCRDDDDIRIKDLLFRPEVQFYGAQGAAGFPVGGPTRTQSGTSLDTANNRDGIIFSTARNYFRMQGDGTSNASGSIILYVPDSSRAIAADPITAVVSNFGRVRLFRWHSETSSWAKK